MNSLTHAAKWQKSLQGNTGPSTIDQVPLLWLRLYCSIQIWFSWASTLSPNISLLSQRLFLWRKWLCAVHINTGILRWIIISDYKIYATFGNWLSFWNSETCSGLSTILPRPLRTQPSLMVLLLCSTNTQRPWIYHVAIFLRSLAEYNRLV
jgi:hypothetical protein